MLLLSQYSERQPWPNGTRGAKFPPQLYGGNLLPSHEVESAYLKVTFGNSTTEFSHQPHTDYAVGAFLPISAQTWACLLLSDGRAGCTISSAFFKSFFVFCQSGAHFASPWQTQVYFLLGSNTCGSQMKETAPRESLGFQQPVDEAALCLSPRFLRDRVSLLEEVKVQKEGR